MGVLPSGVCVDAGLIWPAMRYGALPRSDSNGRPTSVRARACLGGWCAGDSAVSFGIGSALNPHRGLVLGLPPSLRPSSLLSDALCWWWRGEELLFLRRGNVANPDSGLLHLDMRILILFDAFVFPGGPIPLQHQSPSASSTLPAPCFQDA